MCGIAGTLAYRLDEADLRGMTDRIAHRGPDQAGHWQDDEVQLGFRRLAIIDLSPAGHQPMCNEDGTLWLVFNGEVYNYKSLRTELVKRGHVFGSQTDSETILHGYETWGDTVIERLRGMFALALWDQRKRRLLLARDRVGIKPLYYYWDGQRFAFASELKAFLGLPGLDLRIDHSALWDYLSYLYVPTPKTVYANIRQLLPGHTLTLSLGEAPRLRKYWDLDTWGVPLGVADPTAAPGWAASLARLDAKLDETVAAHMVADVPVGLLLSGGLDSSTVTAYAQRYNPEPLRSFSIGFDVAEHSELDYARLVAEHCQTRHYERTITGSGLEEALTRMLMLYDQPFADASGMPTLAVSELAVAHVKVALSGDGGDEILGGYRWYRLWEEIRRSDRLPAPTRALLYERLLLPALSRAASLPRVTGLIQRGLVHVRGKWGADRYFAMTARIKDFQKPRLLPDIANEFRGYDNAWVIRQHWRDDLDDWSAMQYCDLKTYLPDDILTKVDRASMAVSLELRPPLLDHELLEMIAAMPTEFRRDKAVLRATVAKHLPDRIIHRGKKGFSAPLLDWLPATTINGARLGGLQLWAVKLLEEWQASQEAGAET